MDQDKISEYLEEGKIQEVIELLDSLDKRKLTTKERILSKIYMTYVYLELGKFDKTIALINKVIDQTRNSNDIENYLDALHVKSRALFNLGEIQDAMNCISLGKEIFQSLNPLDNPTQHKKLLIKLLLIEGEIYLYKNDHKKLYSLCKECLSLTNEIDDKINMATTFNILGISYLRLGDFDQALDYFEEAKSIYKQLNDKGRLAIAEHHIGFIFANKGQYHIALKQYEKTLDYVEKSNNKFRKSIQYLHMGIAYHAIGKLEQAKYYFNYCLDLYSEVKRNDMLSQVLVGLFNISIRQNDFLQAQTYFEQLKELDEQIDDNNINQKIRLIDACILIQNPNGNNYAKAEELLRGIINEETTIFNIKSLAIEKLASVLLKEYQITGSYELFDELNSLSTNLLSIAKIQKNPYMQFSSLIIKIFTFWIHAMFHEKKSEIVEIKLLIETIKELALIMGYGNLSESIVESQKSLDFELKNNKLFMKKYFNS